MALAGVSGARVSVSWHAKQGGGIRVADHVSVVHVLRGPSADGGLVGPPGLSSARGQWATSSTTSAGQHYKRVSVPEWQAGDKDVPEDPGSNRRQGRSGVRADRRGRRVRAPDPGLRRFEPGSPLTAAGARPAPRPAHRVARPRLRHPAHGAGTRGRRTPTRVFAHALHRHALPPGARRCPFRSASPQVESLTAARNACRAGTEPSDAIRVVNAVLTQIDQIKR